MCARVLSAAGHAFVAPAFFLSPVTSSSPCRVQTMSPPRSRPKTVNDVTHQEEVINTLRTALESSNMPHLMFYGPPGTGKTTTALAIGRELFG